MSLKETLINSGFSEDEAKSLASNSRFAQHYSNKSAGEIKERIKTIADIYCTTEAAVRKAVFSHPQFAGYDHQRVLRGIKDTYNCTAEQASKAVFSHPPFTGLDHQRVLQGIKDAYNCTAGQASKAVFSHPPFAGYDHQRVLQGIRDTYKCTAEQASKAVFSHSTFANLNHKRVLQGIKDAYKCTEEQASKAVLSFPPFANLNHKRVLQGIKDAYNCTAEQASKAVLSNPPFTSLDHQRVLRQLSRIGRIVGLERSEVIERILKNPVLASYSAKRYLAAVDIGRELRKECIYDKSNIARAWFSYPSKSPYVPDTKRLRIAQAAKRGINGEPPLMTAMRKRLRFSA